MFGMFCVNFLYLVVEKLLRVIKGLFGDHEGILSDPVSDKFKAVFKVGRQLFVQISEC